MTDWIILADLADELMLNRNECKFTAKNALMNSQIINYNRKLWN